MSGDIVAAGLSAVGAKGADRTVELGPSGAARPGTGDIARFAGALGNAEPVGGVSRLQGAGPMNSLMKALDGIDVQARAVADYAKTSEASGGELTPGEIVNLTMRCQEFMFQCQLTSNIANRSADGVQQLFRQQG